LFTEKRYCDNVKIGGKGLNIGGSAMEKKVGDTVRSILDGIEYQVKKIVESKAVLESQDGKRQIITELENLTLFYKEKGEKAL
jgi:hypothetical protein